MIDPDRAAAAERLRTAADLLSPAPSPEAAGLRELSEAATPGPWKQDTGVHDNVVRAEGDFEWIGVAGHRHDLPEPVFSGQVSNRSGQHVADAAFIVAAVNHVRAALALTPSQADRGLDAAWAEAEALGGGTVSVRRWAWNTDADFEAYIGGMHGLGATPSEAIRAAARLLGESHEG